MQKISNQYAAMPSLHFAWAVWCTCVLYPACRRRWTRALAVAHPIATVFAVVVTANHYLLDVVGGAVVFGVACLLARPLTAWERASGSPAAGAVR
jgi:membrane-associated phospholipid phosphatase